MLPVNADGRSLLVGRPLSCKRLAFGGYRICGRVTCVAPLEAEARIVAGRGDGLETYERDRDARLLSAGMQPCSQCDWFG